MTYTFISITDFLSNTQSPSKEELELFSKHRDRFLRTNENESEEHQKIALIEFLSQSFAYECNTKNRIDLSIYEDSKAKVLFEVKSLSNTNEFIRGGTLNTLQTLESKAFYESILYFLREYKTHNNNNLKYIILTNTRDFYLIDAREYLQFAKDKTILKTFDNCEKGQGVDTSTSKFYTTLKDYLPTLNSTLEFTHFTIQDTPLALLYQALSPQVLLKRKTYIDANTLNQSFYDELLYILGLKEISQNGKVLIQASDTQNTLLDSIANAFQLSPQDDFETIFSLLTTWNNRILFLRLLESMLLSFKHIDKPFLDIDILKDFTDLNTLFFKILAIRENKRQSIPKELDSIPYLNSSLFDKTELEREGKEIKLLDSKTIAIFKHSILKKDKDYKDTKSLSLLDYLFRFLHAYDFTTTPKDIQDNIKINHDKLINASVLGLVFEKLNGYKEGSFYTPSFITSYMCKESLEKVIIDKFNTAKSWECDSLESLEQKLDKLTDSKDGYKEANTIFDSIKVCDPAVGSGHFLVSMLNAMIELKYRLKILCEIHFDDKGERQYKRLKDIDLKLENDEILIKDSSNTLHMYQTPAHENIESHTIQKALFHNKRILIESCLFGVDINPNSCEITKLRLWIELLKYSYYIFENGKNTNTLQTLPNIDINIKCGNSLISRFDLKDSLKHIPNINHQIAKYQKLVSSYKNTDQSTLNISKQEIEAQIEKIKQTFTLTLKDPKTKQELEKAIETHITNYGISLLDNTSLLDGLSYTLNMFGNPQLSKEQENEAYISYGKIMALRKKLDSFTSGESYKNAFEWRFEFPEVLDSNGDFLGFDLVIGNPPYGVDLSKNERELYKKTYNTSQTNTAALFIFLSDRILAPNGINTLIVPKSLNYVAKWGQLRDFIAPSMYLLADCGKAWDYVFLEMVIFARAKGKNYSSYENLLLQDNTNTQDSKAKGLNIDKSLIELFGLFINGMSEEELKIGKKIKSEINTSLLDFAQCFRGGSFQKDIIEKSFNKAYKVLGGKEVQKYYVCGVKGYISQSAKISSEADIKENSILLQRIIAHIQNPTPHIKFTATILQDKDYKIVNTIFQIICNKNVSNKLILGLLHSKFLNWYCYRFAFAKAIRSMDFSNEIADKIPIPKINAKNQTIANQIIALVDQILESKATDSTFDISNLESQIDFLVYKLYNLTKDEIKIIEGK